MSTKARPPTLGLVAPSGALPDGMADRAAKFFAARGWRVQAGESCFARDTRFAGPDELRLHDLQRFATDRSIDVVLSARGGYGLSRLLDAIDFESIRRADRIIVGISDFTAFSLAYLARADGISFQGPSPANSTRCALFVSVAKNCSTVKASGSAAAPTATSAAGCGAATSRW